MCLAVVGQIEELDGEVAVVNIVGNRVKALAALVPEAVVGDWVLIHAGLAVTIITEEEARETMELMQEKYSIDE